MIRLDGIACPQCPVNPVRNGVILKVDAHDWEYAAGSGDCFAALAMTTGVRDREDKCGKDIPGPALRSSALKLSLRGAAPRRDAAIPKVREDVRDSDGPG